MTVGTALEFISHNVNWVVASLVIAILLLLIPILWIAIRTSPETQDSETLKGLEGSLKKLLEEAQVGGAKASESGQASGSSENFEREKQELLALQSDLRSQLQAKESELAELRQNGATAAAGAGGSGAVSPEMEKQLHESEDRVRELEARLREYEIIEDDIADLSNFKEENAKLRQEIQKLKAGVVSPFAQDESNTPASQEAGDSRQQEVAESAPMPDVLDDLTAIADAPAAVEESPSAQDEPVPALITQADIDALMNQAAEQMVSQEESTVEQMLTEETFKDASQHSPQGEDLAMEIEKARKEVQALQPSGDAPNIGDQLLAELESAVSETEKVNPDDLLNEFSNIDTSKTAHSNSLDIELNPDLIAAEVEKLEKE